LVAVSHHSLAGVGPNLFVMTTKQTFSDRGLPNPLFGNKAR